MHELGIARSICAAVAEATGGRKASSFRVEVGALAGVSVDALDFCIREVARDCGLGEPEIRIVTTPAEMRCKCGRVYEAEDPLEGCPSCGGYDRKITGGLDVAVGDIQEA